MLFLGMINGIHALLASGPWPLAGPMRPQWSKYESGTPLEFQAEPNEVAYLSIRLDQPTEMDVSGYWHDGKLSMYRSFTSDTYVQEFKAESNGVAARLDIPLPVLCNSASTFGRLDGKYERGTFYAGRRDEPLNGALNFCIFPVTYSEGEKMTVKLNVSHANGAVLFDSQWKRLSECPETECKFEDIGLGNVIVVEVQDGADFSGREDGLGTRVVDIEKDGSHDYDACRETKIDLGSDSYLFEGSKTTNPRADDDVLFSNSFTCKWVFPWWGILVIVLGSLIIIGGSVTGGIMCCYCGVCTCCGCCTHWAEKDIGETVDA